jgi:predicted MFS family arabinose efflux permease
MALVLFGVSGLIGNWIFGYIQDRFVKLLTMSFVPVVITNLHPQY